MNAFLRRVGSENPPGLTVGKLAMRRWKTIGSPTPNLIHVDSLLISVLLLECSIRADPEELTPVRGRP